MIETRHEKKFDYKFFLNFFFLLYSSLLYYIINVIIHLFLMYIYYIYIRIGTESGRRARRRYVHLVQTDNIIVVVVVVVAVVGVAIVITPLRRLVRRTPRDEGRRTAAEHRGRPDAAAAPRVYSMCRYLWAVICDRPSTAY